MHVIFSRKISFNLYCGIIIECISMLNMIAMLLWKLLLHISIRHTSVSVAAHKNLNSSTSSSSTITPTSSPICQHNHEARSPTSSPHCGIWNKSHKGCRTWRWRASPCSSRRVVHARQYVSCWNLDQDWDSQSVSGLVHWQQDLPETSIVTKEEKLQPQGVHVRISTHGYL